MVDKFNNSMSNIDEILEGLSFGTTDLSGVNREINALRTRCDNIALDVSSLSTVSDTTVVDVTNLKATTTRHSNTLVSLEAGFNIIDQRVTNQNTDMSRLAARILALEDKVTKIITKIGGIPA